MTIHTTDKHNENDNSDHRSLWYIAGFVTRVTWCMPRVVMKHNENDNSDNRSLWYIAGFVTRVTRCVPRVVKELFTLQEHLSSSSVFSGVRVARSLVYICMFCRSLFVLLSIFLWPFIVCSTLIYSFWLLLWYLQSFLPVLIYKKCSCIERAYKLPWNSSYISFK